MQSIVWSTTQLVASFVLPPGVLLVLMAIGMSQGPNRRWGRWLTVASLVLLTAISIRAVAYLLTQPFEAAWPPLSASAIHGLPKGAMIVVLGGGRTLGAIEYPEHEALSAASLRRSRYGVRLAKETGLPLSVSGGRPGGGELSEGVLMRRLIEDELNYPVAIVEDQSFDTRQSAQFMAERLERLGIQTVVLVTDVLHMPRAVRAFESFGLHVIPAPLNFRTATPLRPPDFLPSAEGLWLSQSVFHELIGNVWYRWRRAIGGLFPPATEKQAA